MYVVIDSTEFFSNRLLEGVDIEIVNAHAQRSGGAVVFPQVVIEEAIKRQRSQLSERYEALRKELQAFERIYRHSEPEWSPPELAVDLARALKSYEDDLGLRVQELGAVVLRYDELPLAPLVSRCMECKRPFDTKGRTGFRDAVIWASVVQFLRDNPKTCYLVTNNKNDFCDGSSLHADLQDDLRAADLTPALVQVSESLSALAKQLGGDDRPIELPFTAIRPQFGLFDVHEFLEEQWDNLKFDFYDFPDLKRTFERILGVKVFSDPSLGFATFDPETVRVYGIDRATSEGCLLIRLTVSFYGDSEVLMSKRDLVRVLRRPDPSLVRLKAQNVFAWIPVDGTAAIEVIANPRTGEVDEAKVLRLNIEPDLAAGGWDVVI